MSELIERGAKILATKWMLNAPHGSSPDMPYWRDMMRTAIESMREPTPEILNQLDELLETQGYHQTIEQSWRLLIDAALATEPVS